MHCALSRLHGVVFVRAVGLSECGMNVTWPLNATFRQVKAHVAGTDDTEAVTLAESALYLIRRNPHWGIRFVCCMWVYVWVYV